MPDNRAARFTVLASFCKLSRGLDSMGVDSTLSAMIRKMLRLSLGRPAESQFFQTANALNKLDSTEVCGLNAASNAANRGASSSKISRSTETEPSYHPRFAWPASATAAISRTLGNLSNRSTNLTEVVLFGLAASVGVKCLATLVGKFVFFLASLRARVWGTTGDAEVFE